MAIIGAHMLLYSSEADALRTILRDVLGRDGVDAGGGWPIFALPPAEVAVHPAGEARHELSLMCDDLDATVEELRAKGVEFRGGVHTERWGRATTMVLPGELEVLLYEPSHPTAI